MSNEDDEEKRKAEELAKEEREKLAKEEREKKQKESNENNQDTSKELKIATEMAKRLNDKLEEIKEVEKNIDDKMDNFKAFVKETETHGITKAGQEKTEAQKEKEAAMSLVEGTGLNPFADEN